MRPVIQAFGHVLTPLVQSFHRSLENPQAAQARVQAELCDRLTSSDYGAHHGISSVDDWENLPIVDYDDIREWVERQLRNPDAAILTPDPILFYEQTSGSRGAAKQIPYTRGLRQSFSQLFCVWAHDLIQHGPRFSTGNVYFCVSPTLAHSPASHQATNPQTPTDSLLDQSLQDDADYLDPWLQRILNPFLVTVPNIGRIRSAEEFKQALGLRLIQAEKLETLSLWSPSFLLVQLSYIKQNRRQLLQSLGNAISDRRRAALMSDPISWVDVWPHLKFISCWDSANAADQANHIRSQFPGIFVQGKGLLATEAPMTVPLTQAQQTHGSNSCFGHVPLLNEVFFEFEPITDDSISGSNTSEPTVYQLHELQEGQDYRIIVSQKGGLYRYRMGDRVRVTHFYRQTPCLAFLGRDRFISDMVGEKLNSDFVSGAVKRLPIHDALFKSLIPVWSPHPHYVLLLESHHQSNQDNAASLSRQLEKELSLAHHYKQARLLGQLDPAQVYFTANAAEQVIQHKLRLGQRWGDIKHSILETKPWEHAVSLKTSYK